MADPKPKYSLLADLQQNKPFVIEVRVIATRRTTFYVKSNSYRISFDVKDQAGTLARLVAYTKPLCDKMEALFQVDKAYLIQRATLKFVEAQYRNADIPFDIQLTPFTKITQLKDEESRVPKFSTQYHKIENIADLPIGSSANVVAFLAEIGEIEVNQNNNSKREMVLEDATGSQITITFWGEHIKNTMSYNIKDILTIHRAKVVNYQGLSLQTNAGTQIQVGGSINKETNDLRDTLQARQRSTTPNTGSNQQNENEPLPKRRDNHDTFN